MKCIFKAVLPLKLHVHLLKVMLSLLSFGALQLNIHIEYSYEKLLTYSWNNEMNLICPFDFTMILYVICLPHAWSSTRSGSLMEKRKYKSNYLDNILRFIQWWCFLSQMSDSMEYIHILQYVASVMLYLSIFNYMCQYLWTQINNVRLVFIYGHGARSQEIILLLSFNSSLFICYVT